MLNSYVRAEALCERLGDRAETFTALRGRGQYYMISGRPEEAQEMARRCGALLEDLSDPAQEIETCHLFWTNGLFIGDYATAAQHAERAVEICRPDRHHPLTFRYSGHDPGVCCRVFSGLSLVQQGQLGRAGEPVREGLELAETFSHPLTSALAYWGLSYHAMLTDNAAEALARAEREIELCESHLLPLLLSQGHFQAGWATAVRGDRAAGIALMERGVRGIEATGAEMGLPWFLALLAQSCADAGELDKALHLLDRAQTSALRNGAAFQFSEILRIKADVLLRASRESREEAEALLRAAIDSARRQGASLPQTRSLSALGRLLAETGRTAEAEDLMSDHSALVRQLEGA